MSRGGSGSGRGAEESRLRAAFRAIEAQPVPDRLKAHLEALARTARKDPRS